MGLDQLSTVRSPARRRPACKPAPAAHCETMGKITEAELAEQASAALAVLTEVVRLFVAGRTEGARNDEVARTLELQTDIKGGQRNHLTHAILNGLVARGTLKRVERGRYIYYLAE